MTLYANTSGQDSLRVAFPRLAEGTRRIRFASPFFSYSQALESLAKDGRSIHLIVRLGPSTNPEHLRDVLKLSNIHVRYFTSRRFHTKLYIFGDQCALVGSANLTGAGLQRNREAAVTVHSSNPDFEALVRLYESYWSEADVFTKERLEKYDRLYRELPSSKPERDFVDVLKDEFGDILPSAGIQVDIKKQSSDKLYLEDYRRKYQTFLTAFREIESTYKKAEIRKVDDVPLRIEIDQFFNYIRQKHCHGEEFRDVPLLSGNERTDRVARFLKHWEAAQWEYLTERIPTRFEQINSRFGTTSAIEDCNLDDILEALEICHSFKEQLRFHEGGLPTLRAEFREEAEVSQVQESLEYLLHGEDSFVERMGALIFEEGFHIPKCGRSVTQELLGWVNSDNIPICNSRTLKSIRHMGFDVTVPG